MPTPDTLPQYLATMRARIDRALEAYLPKPPAAPPLLVEAMRYSLTAGGKRLRPILTKPNLASVLSSSLRNASNAEKSNTGDTI